MCLLYCYFLIISLALKKSQKEASILVQQILRGKEIEGHGQGNCNKLSKLEPDLTGNWRSLFLHTEDILVRERNQLVSTTHISLLAYVQLSK